MRRAKHLIRLQDRAAQASRLGCVLAAEGGTERE